MLVIEEKGKQGYQDKNLTEGRWEQPQRLDSNPGQIGGRPVLSPQVAQAHYESPKQHYPKL